MLKHSATRFRAFSLSLLMLLLLVGRASGQDVVTKSAELDKYMTAAADAGLFSGSVLVAHNGKILLEKGYREANIELGVPNTPVTRFRLGSITKQFTAAAILLLEEQGKLSINDPICNFFTDCPPAWKPITVRHLLNHTSGIPNFTSFPDYMKTMMIPTPLDGIIARFKDRPLTFAPGEKMSYSNSGYILLGAIIEKVAGQSYADFLQARIFGPLKMQGSGYDTGDKIIKGRADGYSNAGGEWKNASHIDMSIPHAAGALYSTVQDLYLWDQALNTDRILSAKSREAMFAPGQNNYAFGWAINKLFNRLMIGHGGGINGFSTYIARYPEEKLTIIVLSNLEQARSGNFARDLAAIVLGEKYVLPRARAAIKLDPRIYDAYVGKYELAPNFILTVKRAGERLMVQATGQPEIEILPESETKFFLRGIEAQITFVKDGSGKVSELILHQNGDRAAKKIE